MTPEGKVKVWARYTAYEKVFPGHKRISPAGGAFGQSGTSDDVLCWRGAYIAIEIKSETGTATALQLNELKEVISAGGTGAVLRGKDMEKLWAIRRVVEERMAKEWASP